MPRDYLDDIANEVLGVAVASLTEPMTGVPSPSKVYVSFGDPVADFDGCCDEELGGGILTVHIGGPSAGDPLIFTNSARGSQCSILTTARFTVTLLRCYPAIGDQPDSSPAATVLDNYSRQRLIDLWCLTRGFTNAVTSGDLASDCADVSLVASRQIEPLGGCGGWQLVLDWKTNDPGPGVGS